MGERVSAEVVANRRRWVEALESGEYRQNRGYLASGNGSFCCLGVACEVSGMAEWEGIDYLDHTIDLPDAVVEFYGLAHSTGLTVNDAETDTLATLNDQGWTFAAIAALLRERFGPDFDRPPAALTSEVPSP